VRAQLVIRTVGFLQKLSAIDDVTSQYTGTMVFLETVYYRLAFLNIAHPDS